MLGIRTDNPCRSVTTVTGSLKNMANKHDSETDKYFIRNMVMTLNNTGKLHDVNINVNIEFLHI